MRYLYRKSRNLFIEIYFFLIVIAGSQFCNQKCLTSYFELASLAVLICGIVKSRMHSLGDLINIKIGYYILTLFLLLIGVVVQEGALLDKLSVICTAGMIWFVFFEGQVIVNSLEILRRISYSSMAGIFASMFLSCVSGISLYDVLGSSAVFKWGFNGGILYKNYFASDILIVFVGLYLYRRFVKKTNLDFFFEIIALFLIVISFSKGAWLLLLSFLIGMNWMKVRRIKAKQRKLIIIGMALAMLGLFVVFYSLFSSHIQTFRSRTQGWDNYVSYYSKDFYHLVWGNAVEFLKSDLPYVYAVRAKVGWNGTLEMAWLNVLIKNGIVGIFGYVLIFLFYFYKLIKEKGLVNQAIHISVFVMLLLSSFVEIYMQSLHNPFGMYCYLILAGLNFDNRKVIQRNCRI